MIELTFTIKQVANILGGQTEGNPNTVIDKITKIDAGEAGGLAFLIDKKFEPFIYTTKASAVIVKEDFVPVKKLSCVLIRIANPQEAFVKLLQFYDNLKPQKLGISKGAHIAKTTKIGTGVYIGEGVVVGENVVIGDHVKIYPLCYIGDNVRIGDNTMLYAGVKIYDNCLIGADCILQSGAVIGGDGFGFMPDQNFVYEKIPQLGNVIIEDNVEIGSNACVDRATFSSTIIRKGVKIDNLTQVAHNCEIGENTVIAACCGIAGSVRIGKNCIFAGQVGIKDHVVIGDRVMVGSQAGIHRNVKSGQRVIGSPALPVEKGLKALGSIQYIPELIDRVNELEKKLK
ncbi:MAG: UDP-3-O-(3-hydroxymyristoyl)glucosamine N-acyltransferase [Bacteroidales bacterium]|nr:UDP-3-O-(3-hydroxymyristoyl)glucosamine N-acyltransferase [Bacteroidales bacterium]